MGRVMVHNNAREERLAEGYGSAMRRIKMMFGVSGKDYTETYLETRKLYKEGGLSDGIMNMVDSIEGMEFYLDTFETKEGE